MQYEYHMTPENIATLQNLVREVSSETIGMIAIRLKDVVIGDLQN